MNRLYIVALSMLLLASGCQQEEISAPGSDASVQVVYASTEDMPDTRTYMSGTEIFWSSGDQIAVFFKNTLRKRFDVTPESVSSKNATFLQDSDYIMAGSNVSISNNVAYYPFCDVICVVKGTSYVLSNITLPSTQNYVLESAGLGTYPMVAVTESTDELNFAFKNICGALMFQLKGSGFIRLVSIKGNSNEVLAGSAVVSASRNQNPSISMSDDGDKVVTLDCGERGVELDEDTPTSFIIALPPVPFANGFTITVTDTWGGTKDYSTSKANAIQRSKILRMPAQNYIGARLPQEGDYIDEYGVNHGQGIEIDGVVWAPVNCGYKAPTADSKGFPYGKLYQWGRKYGQDYETELTTENIIDPLLSVFMGSMADKSNVFYLSWTNYTNTRLWNLGTDSDPVKTEYDPCPQGWRVPTNSELGDLIDNYTSRSTNNGQSGRWFSGSRAYQDSCPSVFLPFAGYLNDSGSAKNRTHYGYYWSSQRNKMLYMSFSDAQGVELSSNTYACGCAVRCVRDNVDLIPVENITLSKTSLTLSTRDSEIINAIVSPQQASHKDVFWISDNEDVATVDTDGKVRAIKEGTATIIAIAGMKMASCTVTIKQADVVLRDYKDEYGVNHGPGVNIDGIVWAPVNCGYHKTDFRYGKLYQWGRKYGQGYSGKLYDLVGNYIGEVSDAEVPVIEEGGVSVAIGNHINSANIFYTGTSSYRYDWIDSRDNKLWNSDLESTPVKTEYDPCPEGWRVPTYDELKGLRQNYSYWTSEEGNNGYWFSGSNPYSETVPQVFFPAAGDRSSDGTTYFRGNAGYYWSSKAVSSQAYYLGLYSSSTEMGNSARADASSVRCVQD